MGHFTCFAIWVSLLPGYQSTQKPSLRSYQYYHQLWHSHDFRVFRQWLLRRPKKTFFDFPPSQMKNGCNFVKKWHRKIFIIDPLIGSSYHFEVLHCNYNGEIGQKWDFWLEGPIDLRPTRLNCILQDLFRYTPLDHIWRAQVCSQICQMWPNMPNLA